MHKILEYYRIGKKNMEELESLKLKGNRVVKAVILTVLSALVLASPLAILIILLYFQYSPVMPFYWILTVITSILLVMLNCIASIIYVELIQIYFPEIKETTTFNLRAIFIKELLNPLNLLIIVVFLFLLTRFY